MKIATAIIVFLSYTTLYAQVPSWAVNYADFAKNMSVNLILDDQCSSFNDRVAVFDNTNLLRGVSDISDGDKVFFITVYSNNPDGETLHFKYYDSESDEVFNLTTQTFQFNSGELLGIPDPITITSPESIAPISRCKSTNAYLDETGSVTIPPDDVDNGSSDNCGIIYKKVNHDKLNCSHLSGAVVTLVITDLYSNKDSCEASVSVFDTIKPIANCKNFIVHLDSLGKAQIVEDNVDDNSIDNCFVANRTLSKNTFNNTEPRDQNIHLIVTDQSGNIDSCQSAISIINIYENDVINCNDGIDNDNDGLVDCDDPECGKPVISNIDIITPTSMDCELSNPDGKVSILQTNANQFSIDSGMTYQSNSIFNNVTSGYYDVFARNSVSGCTDEDEIDIVNTFAIRTSTVDITLNCLDNRDTFLHVDVQYGTAPFSYVWKDTAQTIIPNNEKVKEGQYHVLVTDANGCENADTVQLFLSPDPLIGEREVEFTGPAIICPTSKDVIYTTGTVNLNKGWVKWLFDGTGVTLNSALQGLRVSADYSSSFEDGNLVASYGNLCSTTFDTIKISHAIPYLCNTYANCLDSTNITTGLLLTSDPSFGAPNVYRANRTMIFNATVPIKTYEFSAGKELIFNHGFEVQHGAQINAEIKNCKN